MHQQTVQKKFLLRFLFFLSLPQGCLTLLISTTSKPHFYDCSIQLTFSPFSILYYSSNFSSRSIIFPFCTSHHASPSKQLSGHQFPSPLHLRILDFLLLRLPTSESLSFLAFTIKLQVTMLSTPFFILIHSSNPTTESHV